LPRFGKQAGPVIRETLLVSSVDIVLSEIAAAVGSVLIRHYKITGIALDSVVVLFDEALVQSGLVFMRDDFLVFPFVDHHGYSGIIVIDASHHRLFFFIDDEDEGTEIGVILTDPFVSSQCVGHAGIRRCVRCRCNQSAGQQDDDAIAKVWV